MSSYIEYTMSHSGMYSICTKTNELYDNHTMLQVVLNTSVRFVCTSVRLKWRKLTMGV